MSEHKRWYPDLSNKPGINPVEIASIYTVRLSELLTQPHPSFLLVGLPAHHLLRFSEFAHQAPVQLVEATKQTPQQFIEKSATFDQDIIAVESLAHQNSEDPYITQRRIHQIVQAILRGNIPTRTFLKILPSSLQDCIKTELQEYQSGNKIYHGLKAEDLFKKY